MMNNPMLIGKNEDKPELSAADLAILASRARPLSDKELAGFSFGGRADWKEPNVKPYFELRQMRLKGRKEVLVPFVGVEVSF